MKTFSRKFAEIALQYSDKAAVSDANGSLTYGEIDRISNNIAHFLHTGGFSKKRIVILLRRSRFVPVVSIGVMRAGCCILPVDADYPAERIRQILENSGSCCVLTTADLEEQLCKADHFFEQIRFLNALDLIRKPSDHPSMDLSSPSDEGVMLYTSGSTGVPKGIIHDNRFIPSVSLNQWQDVYTLTDRDVCGCMAGLSFTVVFCDMYSALSVGARLYILNETERMDLALIKAVIDNEGITCMFMPPKLLKSFAETYTDSPLACVWTGGEKLQKLPETSFTVIENYGCSEGGFILYRRVGREDAANLLGRPSPHCSVCLLDNDGNALSEEGVIGELCVTGEGVASAYHGLPELTGKKFTLDPNGRIMFHTGDLMTWCENGMLEFHGRNDYMVKLNGFRIELSEVENAVLSFPGVQETACVVRKINGGDHLCCFFAGTGVSAADTDALKARLASGLPAYMIPSYLIHLPKLPRNLNGKIDRKALPDIDVRARQSSYEPPRNETEAQIVRAFAETLEMNASDISVLDSFFDLGGNSILAMKLLLCIGMDGLTSMDIFRERTARGIAEALQRKGAALPNDPDATERAARALPHSLTRFQTKLFADQSVRMDSTVWNVPTYFRLENGTDAQRLCSAINEVLKCHPVFFTMLHKNPKGTLTLHCVPESLTTVQVEYLSEQQLRKLEPDLVLPFDLFEHPLYRIRVFETEAHVYLFMDIHHLLMDGTGLGILTREFVQVYQGKSLAAKDYYYTFLSEQEQILKTDEYQRAYVHCREAYGDLRHWCRIPDRDFDTGDYAIDITGILPSGLTVDDLTRAEKRLGASRNVMAVAAALISMYAQTGCADIMVSWIYNNRSNPIYDCTVGSLNKELPVALHLMEGMSVSALIEAVNKQVIDSIANSACEYLAENYVPFDTDTMYVNYLNGIRNYEALDALDAVPLQLERRRDISKTSMGLAVFEQADGQVLIGIEYCSSFYAKETMQRYHRQYQKVFVHMVRDSSEVTIHDIL